MGKFNILPIILPFIVGGFLVGGITIISRKFSSKPASLFAALPWAMLTSTILVYYETRHQYGTDKVKNLMKNNVPGVALILGLYLTFWLTLDKTDIGFWPSLGSSVAVWVGLAVVYWMIVCPSPLKEGKCLDI
jgi:hypothetical protein